MGAQGIGITEDRRETLEKRYWCVSDGVKSRALYRESQCLGQMMLAGCGEWRGLHQCLSPPQGVVKVAGQTEGGARVPQRPGLVRQGDEILRGRRSGHDPLRAAPVTLMFSVFSPFRLRPAQETRGDGNTHISTSAFGKETLVEH